MKHFEESLGMPLGQVNAHVKDELTMRVGVPHRSGALPSHAFNQGYPAMVSASAFWNPAKGCFQIPDATDLEDMDFALDSAGFTAMMAWRYKGTQTGLGGIFPWSLGQYLELASQIPCAWYSQPDCCCEPEIASSREEIDFRINATATFLEATLQHLYEWQNQLAREGWSARMLANALKPPVPVVQGWSVSDYQQSLELMGQVWDRWQPWVAPPALIGIGSVCRRQLNDPNHGLYAILGGIRGMLPQGARVHLFGVKGEALNEIAAMDFVASADSMAWDFTARVEARKAQRSNTTAHRASTMSAWMESANRRMRAPAQRMAA